MIRLAIFVDSMHVGGTELNAVRTLERLDRTRFELSVFHTGKAGPLLDRYRALGIPMYHVDVRGFLKAGTIRSGIGLTGLLRAARIQVLHSHDIYSNIMSVPWARAAGVPVVIASKRWIGAVPSRGHVWANRIAYALATHVLANSEMVAQSLREEDHVPRAKIKVLPNFLEPEAYDPYPLRQREVLWRRLGIPAGAIVIGTVARLSAVKNHALLLEAVSVLVRRHAELHVLLVGDGPERPQLEAAAASLAIGDRVHFAGELPNLPNPHALLHISVLSSSTEGFPNTIVEAMAAGRPVVATDVGGVREAVVSGRTGLLVPSGSVPSLAEALGTLLGDPERQERFGSAARQVARAKYDAGAVVGSLENWYAEALATRLR